MMEYVMEHWFFVGVLVFLFVILAVAAGYYARSYYGLRARYRDLDFNLASEMRLNQVLLSRAETAETRVRFLGKQLDALLAVPMPTPTGNSANAIPKMIVIVTGKDV